MARALVESIQGGKIEALQRLLREHPGPASAQLVGADGGSSTPLHAATDWPGFFPRGPEVVAVLIDRRWRRSRGARCIDRGWGAARRRGGVRLLAGRAPAGRARGATRSFVACRGTGNDRARERAAGCCAPDETTAHRRVLAGVPRWPATDGRTPACPRRRIERHTVMARSDAAGHRRVRGHRAPAAGRLAAGRRRHEIVEPRGLTAGAGDVVIAPWL